MCTEWCETWKIDNSLRTRGTLEKIEKGPMTNLSNPISCLEVKVEKGRRKMWFKKIKSEELKMEYEEF